MSNGLVIWEGASLLNGKPVVVIATGIREVSGNQKTGDMIQTWILPQRVKPHVAFRTGYGEAVCGDCPLQKGGCYVDVAKAPLAVWGAYKRGSYSQFQIGDLKGRDVRFGSFGDPAAVPTWVWGTLASEARSVTGYTHAWRTADPRLKGLVMASCDRPEDVAEARALGYRVFLITHPDGTDRIPPSMVPCPSKQGARCQDCGLCNGKGEKDNRKSVYIPAHGIAPKLHAFRKMRDSLPVL